MPPRHRSFVVLLAVAVATLASIGPAGAWSNGRSGSNSFGTHDWVLREGVRLAGKQGRWVCVRVALRATDDPDSRGGLDHASGGWWHVWDEWGERYGGAPEAVAVWFHRAERRLDRGRPCPASTALGIAAHLIGDVAQPMHTDGRLDRPEDRTHHPYEVAVDERCDRDACRFDARSDGFDRSAPARRTRTVARVAHKFYGELVRTFDRSGYTRRVHRITRLQLNRAANALADLIRSM